MSSSLPLGFQYTHLGISTVVSTVDPPNMCPLHSIPSQIPWGRWPLLQMIYPYCALNTLTMFGLWYIIPCHSPFRGALTWASTLCWVAFLHLYLPLSTQASRPPPGPPHLPVIAPMLWEEKKKWKQGLYYSLWQHKVQGHGYAWNNCTRILILLYFLKCLSVENNYSVCRVRWVLE